jgi:hypothetical protein
MADSPQAARAESRLQSNSKWHCGSRRVGGAGGVAASTAATCTAETVRLPPCRIHSLWPKRDESLIELLRRTYTSNCHGVPRIKSTLL